MATVNPAFPIPQGNLALKLLTAARGNTKHSVLAYIERKFDYEENLRIRLVVGGDKLSYDADVSSPFTDMSDMNVLLNSTILDSAKGLRFSSLDLKYIFFTHQKHKNICKLPTVTSLRILSKININSTKKVNNNFIWIHGLKHASYLAYETV